MNKVEYAWRMPREKPSAEAAAEKTPPGFLTGIVDMLETWGEKMQRWLSKIEDWFDKLLHGQTTKRTRSGSDPVGLQKPRG